MWGAASKLNERIIARQVARHRNRLAPVGRKNGKAPSLQIALLLFFEASSELPSGFHQSNGRFHELDCLRRVEVSVIQNDHRRWRISERTNPDELCYPERMRWPSPTPTGCVGEEEHMRKRGMATDSQ